MIINIQGLDKTRVLLELYNHARFKGQAFAGSDIGVPIYGEASIAKEKMRELEEKIDMFDKIYVDYIDLGCGNLPIKTFFTQTTVDAKDYDYYHGNGLAESIITSLRKGTLLDVRERPDNRKSEESMAKIIALLQSVYIQPTKEESDSDYSQDDAVYFSPGEDDISSTSESSDEEIEVTHLKQDESSSSSFSSDEEEIDIEDEFEMQPFPLCTFM